MYFVDFYFPSKKPMSFMTMVVCDLLNMISEMLIVYVTCDSKWFARTIHKIPFFFSGCETYTNCNFLQSYKQIIKGRGSPILTRLLLHWLMHIKVIMWISVPLCLLKWNRIGAMDETSTKNSVGSLYEIYRWHMLT